MTLAFSCQDEEVQLLPLSPRPTGLAAGVGRVGNKFEARPLLDPGGRSKATTSCLFSESFESCGHFRKKLHSYTWSFSNLIMYYDFYFSTLHRSLFVNPSNRNRSYPECIGIRCRPKASSDTRNTSAMGPCLATGTGFNVCFVKKSYPVTNRLGFFRTFQGHMNQQIYINLLVKKW